tara:strand:- start:26 stop:748 length:723 start_codon:yes stop_codon:yes gene_type:complete
VTRFLIINNKYKIAYKYFKRRKKTIIFLHGLMSNMSGKKSNFLANFCLKNDLSFLSFDFQGHGQSSGEFTSFGISDWFNDLENIIKYLKIKNCILVGSSMGGWVAIIYALMHPRKVSKLIGIAPAPDFTTKIIWKNFNTNQKNKIQNNKIVRQKVSSDFVYSYSPELFKRSKKYLLEKIKGDFLGETIFLHGGKDKAVPYGYNDNFNFSKKFKNFKNILVKDADHSLSDRESLKTLSKFI